MEILVVGAKESEIWEEVVVITRLNRISFKVSDWEKSMVFDKTEIEFLL